MKLLAPLSSPFSSKVRVALSRSCARIDVTVKMVLLTGLVSLGACSDAVTAPGPSIDRVAAAIVIPSVTDARLRVAVGIDNEVVRQRAIHDLLELEKALANGDGQKARFHLRVIGNMLGEYRLQHGVAAADGADIKAIELSLFAVSTVVNGHYDLQSAV